MLFSYNAAKIYTFSIRCSLACKFFSKKYVLKPIFLLNDVF